MESYVHGAAHLSVQKALTLNSSLNFTFLAADDEHSVRAAEPATEPYAAAEPDLIDAIIDFPKSSDPREMTVFDVCDHTSTLAKPAASFPLPAFY